LNAVHGEDDLLLKGQLLEKVLQSVPRSDVLSLLPETTQSLSGLGSFKETDLAEHLKNWEKLRAARLKHMQLQFTVPQLTLVEEAIARMLPGIGNSSSDNPNKRSEAIFYICKTYLEQVEKE
jgi:ParB family chromosome partitioning protein